MSKKDLTKLSKKQLESMLAKKYGVDKYLNQKSQLLDLLGKKGETDIQSGFTGPETEALSIILGDAKKAEGGIISLAVGSGGVGSESDDDYSGSGPSANETGSANEGDMGASGGAGDDGSDNNDESIEVSERGDVFGAGPTQYEKDFTQQQIDAYSREVDRNPQLRGFLGKSIKDKIAEKNFNIERNKDGMVTGVYSQAGLPGTLGVLSGLLGGPTTGTVYTGYGKGAEITDSDESSDEPSEMIKKIVEEKEEDLPLTEAELDYYARGMGTATKPLKSLKDVNEYMSSLIGKTGSPTGAKLSKDKKFLILPNGKIINLRTGKVQESMSGLELFRGGLI
tara:strand:- start:6223 stop:7236 length:1014 start_codon:yes stop_codon:yes gene_type:complete